MDHLTLALLALVAALCLYLGTRLGRALARAEAERRLPAVRQEAAARSRAVLGGQFSEQLAPYLPDFPYSPTEVRYIGKPVDFLVFRGLDAREPSEIVFVEVKSGAGRLSTAERKLRDLVEAGRVRWDEYRVPHDVTRR